jgi:hypothetical protein
LELFTPTNCRKERTMPVGSINTVALCHKCAPESGSDFIEEYRK